MEPRRKPLVDPEGLGEIQLAARVAEPRVKSTWTASTLVATRPGVESHYFPNERNDYAFCTSRREAYAVASRPPRAARTRISAKSVSCSSSIRP